MKHCKSYLSQNKKQFALFFLAVVFCSYCFYPKPVKIIEENFQESQIQEEEKKAVIVMQKSIHDFAEGDKCIKKAKNHPCYEQCKKMYYWHSLYVIECQKSLTIPQINILKETFDFLWEPELETLKSIPPDNFKAYLDISRTALNRIIRKYGSREVEHFVLWMISNAKITEIFERTDRNFERLADLLYRVAPYTEKNIYEPFTDIVGNKELMAVVIQSENETIMELFMDFINHTNKACAKEPVSKDCFEVYCRIGRAINKESRRNWRYFEDFNFYLSEIIAYQINSRQGQENDKNPTGWIYKQGNEGSGFSDEEDIRDFVEDLCQGLGQIK